MPPTIQSSRRDDPERAKRGERRSELVCKVKYNNTLPDIPFDPKFITYPFESNRYVQYNQTSLERSYKHELLTEHDLGVHIDLINPATYKIDYHAHLDHEDERLLDEESQGQADSKRSRHHSKSVSWLRKTEYISTEFNRFTPLADKPEARIGYNIKKHFKDEDLYKDRESQLAAIEKTFEYAQTPITKHYSKPGVHPVDILPVFPDFELWKHPCAQVIFDSDPAPKGMSVPAQIDEMSQAMIRGVVDESGEQFVAYFLPTEDTTKKRKRDVEEGKEYMSDEEYDYTLAREYNWNVKNKSSRGYEETYFFVIKENGVYYNELETRVRLSKRRKVAGAGPTPSTRLIVKHRPLDKREEHAQEIRSAMLGPPGEEEEEEEEMELPAGDGNVEDDDLGSFKSGSSRSRSGSRSRSRSRSSSGSRSRSRSRSGSRSRSRSKSGSRSGSGSRSRSRSRSGSRSGSGSRSRSRSRSGSRSGSGSRSRSRSRSGSRSQSRSRSRSRSGSRSRSRSRSRSKSKSRSRSRSRSRSVSPSSVRSGSPAGSGSGSDSGSESEAEKAHKDEEDIFGGGSSGAESG